MTVIFSHRASHIVIDGELVSRTVADSFPSEGCAGSGWEEKRRDLGSFSHTRLSAAEILPIHPSTRVRGVRFRALGFVLRMPPWMRLSSWSLNSAGGKEMTPK